MASLKSIAERLKAALNARAPGLQVGGALVGVAIGGEQVTLAHGTANLNTGQPFTEDTGFLLGSVTKVLTTTVLMRLVERGQVDLDAPAQRYVPEFTLSDPDAAARITVRMLVNHTNGIDCDTLFPWSVRGRDASRSYTAYLPKIGVLFEPGTCIHYTNPGFSIAARIIEECTGLPFERAIQSELFDPAGMQDATAVQTQAFLRRTAIGAVVDPQTKALRATPIFSYGEAAVGAGSTLIVSMADMFAFGRLHLKGGVAQGGARVLSGEMVEAMQTTTFDLGIPQAPPMGLGWWRVPVAGTTAFWHGGASPGGSSSFCILPEYDATIISFATGPGGGALDDILHNEALEELTGRAVTPPLAIAPVAKVAADVAGDYAVFQKTMSVTARDNTLVIAETFEPYDDEHREAYRTIWAYTAQPPVTYESVAPGQFAKAGAAPRDYSGFYGRIGLVATLPATSNRRAGLHTRFRYTPKVR